MSGQKRLSTKSNGKSVPAQRTLLEMFHVNRASHMSLVVDTSSVEPPAEVEMRRVSDSLRDDGWNCGPASHIIKPRTLHPLFTKNYAQKSLVPTRGDQVVVADNDKSLSRMGSRSPSSPDPEMPGPSTQGSGTQDEPIVVDLSPVRPIKSANVRPRKEIPHVAKPAFKNTVPYPTQDSQHVKGEQHFFAIPGSPFPRRSSRAATTGATDGVFSLAYNMGADDLVEERVGPSSFHASDSVTYLKTIPPSHLNQHPAIVRTLNSRPIDLPQLMWSDKWRPRCADEVLGNETNSLYLRDWLLALALESGIHSQSQNDSGTPSTSSNKDTRRNKRPRIVRSVTQDRARKKQRTETDDDDWIAPDDVDMNYDDTPLDEYSQANPNVDTTPHLYNKRTFKSLSNTILLVGPPGVGKTAAVYACAEELGWDVFEVYPGIGKRNGASIDHLVGDVGKNHLIHQTRDVDGPKRQLVTSDFSEALNLTGHGDGAATGFNVDETKVEHVAVRQSMILLEEVDILFKDDVNFWPSVINLIKTCKRPVICTCNDTTFVPIADLPLQATLTFGACPTPVATSYLQAICFVEGRIIERDALARLYENALVVGRGSSHTDQKASCDLRKAIHLLQFYCSTDGGPAISARFSAPAPDKKDASNVSLQTTGAANYSLETVRDRLIGHTDWLSFVDMWEGQRQRKMENLSVLAQTFMDDASPSTLLDPFSLDAEARFGIRDREEEIVLAAMRLSRGLLRTVKGMESIDDNSLGARPTFCGRMDAEHERMRVLEQIVPLEVMLLGREAVWMHYLPYVREMVEGEDREEERHRHRQRAGRRTTRNSGGQYVRLIELDEEGRRLVKGWRCM